MNLRGFSFLETSFPKVNLLTKKVNYVFGGGGVKRTRRTRSHAKNISSMQPLRRKGVHIASPLDRCMARYGPVK